MKQKHWKKNKTFWRATKLIEGNIGGKAKLFEESKIYFMGMEWKFLKESKKIFEGKQKIFEGRENKYLKESKKKFLKSKKYSKESKNI